LALQVIFGFLYSICILYSIYLLFDLWTVQLLKFNVACVCVSLELIGGILRLSWLIDNPLTFKYEIGDAVVFSLHLPCSIICGILMIFFWQDATHTSSKEQQFLSKKYFYGAIVFSILIVLFELAIDLFYALYPGGQTNNLIWLVVVNSYSTIFGLLAIFYFVYCSKALHTIKKIGRNSERFTNLTIKVLFSGFGMVISACQLIINAPQVTPSLFIAWLCCAYLGTFVQSFPQLLLIGSSRPKNISSTKADTDSIDDPRKSVGL